MKETTNNKLLDELLRELAYGGQEAISMRSIADKTGISQSVIYHYYPDKGTMLFQTFLHCTKQLSQQLDALPDTTNAREMLRQRVRFQFDNATYVIAIMKYFVANRSRFEPDEQGWVPRDAYRHIEEVISRGVEEGIYHTSDTATDSKTITHAVNGFILEYYPEIPAEPELSDLISRICDFIERALRKK